MSNMYRCVVLNGIVPSWKTIWHWFDIYIIHAKSGNPKNDVYMEGVEWGDDICIVYRKLRIFPTYIWTTTVWKLKILNIPLYVIWWKWHTFSCFPLQTTPSTDQFISHDDYTVLFVASTIHFTRLFKIHVRKLSVEN